MELIIKNTIYINILRKQININIFYNEVSITCLLRGNIYLTFILL